MHISRLIFILTISCSSLFFPVKSAAQNTGGVFGPVVNEGHQSVQYRLAFIDDSDGFAQRIHYEKALDSKYMWRVIGQTRKTGSSDFDFDYVQGELFWDVTDDTSRFWQSGLRLDVRVRDGNRNETIGLNWMNQFQLSNGWQARLLALTSVDIGSGARDGAGLQTRGNLFKTLPDRKQIGLELYSSYGTTSDFADFDDQRHTLGPFAVIPVGSNGWSIFAGALFGLTESSPDADIRFWVTRNY
ncbi:MAG: hypothetical protein AB8G18_03775 [Gammaproteobacteria bacterium]